MSLVDKHTFENRGARGCSDSSYSFAMTTCCERVGVVDDEQQEFYWSADTPSRSVSLFDDSPCPLCGASAWALHPIDDMAQIPEHWRWACGEPPRRGSRRLRPLAEHVAELLRVCQRVAAPMPPFDAKLFFDTKDARVRHDGGWLVERAALRSASEYAAHFDALLTAGYSSIALSALGVFGDALIIAVAVPTEASGVPVGLTVVNYAGPGNTAGGSPDWRGGVIVSDSGATSSA